MIITFMKIGKKENSIVLLNTDEKTFKYFKVDYFNPVAITVKTEKDLHKIIEKAREDGYALKIG